MKKLVWSIASASLLGLSLAGASMVSAQPPEGGNNPPPPREGQPPGGGRGPRPNPLAEALDKDRDGDISAEELKEATASLQTLDANKDGILSREEMRPPGPPPGGPEGEGRPPGRQPRGPAGEGRPPGGPEAGGAEGFIQHAMSFDADGDGKLSRDELMKLAQALPPRPGQSMRPGQGGRPPGGRGEGPGGPPGAGGRPGRPENDGGAQPERPRRPSAE